MGKMTVSNRCGDKKRPPVQWRDKKRLVIISDLVQDYYTGWWYTYPSEKYESQLGWLFPIYGKIKFMFQTTNQLIIVLHSFATIICPTSRIFQVFFLSFSPATTRLCNWASPSAGKSRDDWAQRWTPVLGDPGAVFHGNFTSFVGAEPRTMIWVNYNNISLTWIKAICGWFPLLTMIPGFGRSEVVIIYPERWFHGPSYEVQIGLTRSALAAPFRNLLSESVAALVVKHLANMEYLGDMINQICCTQANSVGSISMYLHLSKLQNDMFTVHN